MKKIVWMLIALLLSVNSVALELADVKVPDTVQLGGQTLILNGTGIRTKYFFKVYVAALFVSKKHSDAASAINDAAPHRVALYMLRDLSSSTFLNAFNEAIEANHTPVQLEAISAQLGQMRQIFGSMAEVKEGDVVSLDFLPDSGTQVMLNGISRGTIPGAEFNRALMRMWLGTKPVQDDLKKALLGD